MVLPIAAFEVRQRLRRISTYVYFAIFLALGAFFILAAGGAIAWATVDFGTGGKVNINSPWSLSMLMPLMASFGVIITASIAGRATHQDVDSDSTALFFTTPITRMDYLGGRFLGAFGVIAPPLPGHRAGDLSSPRSPPGCPPPGWARSASPPTRCPTSWC